MKSRFLPALVFISLAAVPAVHAQVVITNPSFEANYNPVYPGYSTITGWTGGSGINNNSAGPFADNGNIPDGTQVAFIQTNSGGTTILSQNLTGFTVGDKYVVTFYDNRRAATFNANLAVTLGGVTIVPTMSITPVGFGNPYHFVTSNSYTATTSIAILAFSNTSPDDSAALIDNVKILNLTTSPEPSPAAALTVGILGLGALMLRARRRTA